MAYTTVYLGDQRCIVADTFAELPTTDDIVIGTPAKVGKNDYTLGQDRTWVQTSFGGAVGVYGAPPTARRLSASTYNTTNILGFKILNIGSGTLTLSPASGDTDIVITNAELTLMGINAYVDWVVPELDSITAGTGMELMVFHR